MLQAKISLAGYGAGGSTQENLRYSGARCCESHWCPEGRKRTTIH